MYKSTLKANIIHKITTNFTQGEKFGSNVGRKKGEKRKRKYCRRADNELVYECGYCHLDFDQPKTKADHERVGHGWENGLHKRLKNLIACLIAGSKNKLFASENQKIRQILEFWEQPPIPGEEKKCAKSDVQSNSSKQKRKAKTKEKAKDSPKKVCEFNFIDPVFICQKPGSSSHGLPQKDRKETSVAKVTDFYGYG